ncbi:MAG: HD domain-containing protein [Candidatus Omnitrophica bacterium]|nr:HD domain-containing protein [Candidatus Omnitrophota bacterium]
MGHPTRTKIIIKNKTREKDTFSEYACRSIKAIREKKEEIPDRENIRPSFFHDTDRIIHSDAYSRYIDKTQVFYLFENDHITHRSLHVQLVSKIGRTLGRFLRLNEDLIEAISLGHDLGHVPYGHDGEKVLNEICKQSEVGYFCHNAQSVRFLYNIENKGNGLNLTLQVLDGILAHNGELLHKEYQPKYDKTWNDFLEEYNSCFNEEKFSKKIKPMTLEGCVMRISDIIAYIGRDIEDAIRVRLIKREDIPDAITNKIGNKNKDIINSLVLDITDNSYGKNNICFSEDTFKALKDLMEFNYANIYKNDIIRSENSKVHNMFKMLFNSFCEDLKNQNKDSSIFIHHINSLNKEYLDKTPKERIVIDYIAGMTDDYFNNQFHKKFLPKKHGYNVEENNRNTYT